mgnify:FL=1
MTNFILAGLVGIIIYYAIGLPYMYLILNFYLKNSINILKVIQIGFIPFITLDLAKVVAAALLARKLSTRL